MLAALAVQASMPFAALIVTDAETRWRGPFAAAYLAALAALGLVAVGPEALSAFVVSSGAAYCDECVAAAMY